MCVLRLRFGREHTTPPNTACRGQLSAVLHKLGVVSLPPIFHRTFSENSSAINATNAIFS